MLAMSGICWSRLAFLPLAADSTGGYWRTFLGGDLLLSNDLGAAVARAAGGAVVAGSAEGALWKLRQPARAGLPAVGRGHGSEKGFSGREESRRGKELFGWVVRRRYRC